MGGKRHRSQVSGLLRRLFRRGVRRARHRNPRDVPAIAKLTGLTSDRADNQVLSEIASSDRGRRRLGWLDHRLIVAAHGLQLPVVYSWPDEIRARNVVTARMTPVEGS